MKFAVVGDVAETLFLLQAIHRDSDHSLTLCSVTGSLATGMASQGIPFELVESPEEAIVDAATDAVIVACHDADVSMALCRQASQGGRHLVVIPPTDVSTAFSFEVHLLLDESECGIVPFLGRWYVDELEKAVLASNSIQQMSLKLPLLTDEAKLRRTQLHSIDALSGCGYRFSRITGLDVPSASGQLLSRSITLAASAESGQKMPPAVVSFDRANGAGLTGELRLTTNESETLTLRTALPSPETTDSADGFDALMPELIATLTDQNACQVRMEEFSNILELQAALDKSFRRRRTIDVYFDGVSERSAFKTQMTAIGCGVMSYVTFGLIALALCQAVGMGAGLLKLGMVVWIAPVVFFLLAQLLLPLARERNVQKETPAQSNEE